MHELSDIIVLTAMLSSMALAVGLEWSVCRAPNFALADLAILSLAVGEWLARAGWGAWMIACGVNIALRFAVVMFVLLPMYERRISENRRIAASLGISLLTVAANGLLFETRPVTRGVLSTSINI